MAKFNLLRLTGIAAALISAVSANAQQSHRQRSQLDTEVPAVVARSVDLGHTDPSTVLHLGIALNVDDYRLKQFVDSVSDPSSPNYRQFLSPEQVGQRFGISRSALSKVVTFLRSEGFVIKLASKTRLGITVEGTVAMAEKAFGTRIDDFVTRRPEPLGKARFHANIGSVSVPAEIARYVSNVTNLANFAQPKPSTALTPQNIQSLYNTSPMMQQGRSGQGRTVGITNYDAFDLVSAVAFIDSNHLPTPASGHASNVRIVTIGKGGQLGTPIGEGDLDIQAVLSTAPLANIVVYDGGDGAGSGDIYNTWLRELDDNVADIISDSYGAGGFTDDQFRSFHAIHLAMSAQGITYLSASGDRGTASIGPDQPCYPTIDPDVLSVGGTSVVLNNSGRRLSEIGWATTLDAASGGGWAILSAAFNVLPSYQKGNGVPLDTPYRLVPDVAMDADPDSGLVIYSSSASAQLQGGGTSLAAPLFAGSLATAEQQLIQTGGLGVSASGKRRFGRINDLIYALNGNASVFYDVTVSGYTGVLPSLLDAKCTKGWDFVTGWGAMDFNGFVNFVSKAETVTGLSASPTQLVGGQSVTFTIQLQNPAPTLGAPVTLSSSDRSAFPTLPKTVLVPANSNSVSVTTSTGPVVDIDDVIVTAKGKFGKATVVVTVTQPTIKSITFGASGALGGVNNLGVITLNAPAPSAGIVIALSSSNSAVCPVPGFVSIKGGSSTAVFAFVPSPVNTATSVNIAGTSAGATTTGQVTVVPPAISKLALSQTSVFGTGSNSVTGTVTLTGPAPNLYRIDLQSSNPTIASVRLSLLISKGATTGSFSITPNPVSSDTPVTITTSCNGGTASAKLTLKSAILASVSTVLTTVTSGASTDLKVTLNAPAGPGGLVVAISSSDPTVVGVAGKTSSVTVPEGQTSAIGTVYTNGVDADKLVTISGTLGSVKSTFLRVKAANVVSLILDQSSVQGPTTCLCTVTLEGPAGPSGRKVALKSSNPAVASVPATVTVPANQTTVSFTITTNTVSASKNVTITATLGTSVSATLTVTP